MLFFTATWSSFCHGINLSTSGFLEKYIVKSTFKNLLSHCSHLVEGMALLLEERIRFRATQACPCSIGMSSLINSHKPSYRGLHWRGTAMSLCYPMAVGLNKGQKMKKNMSKLRHSRWCGCFTKHTNFMGDTIQEVCSFTPYELHSAAQGVQGQALAQIHQEQGG